MAAGTAGNSTKLRTWDPRTQFGVSSDELGRIEERAKLRDQLKKEWKMKASNPYRGSAGSGYVFDPAIQRFYSMRAWGWHYFKVTPKTVACGLGLLYGPLFVFWRLISWEKGRYENKCRNGLPYADRKFKFI